jgi:hypothetical protein
VYSELLKKHRAQGSTVVEVIDSTGQPRATITPSLADKSFGTPFTLHARLGDEVEKILADKNLPNTAIVGDYMAKRAGNRAGALADLRKVNSVEDLDALMEQTLGKDAVATRKQDVEAALKESESNLQPQEQLKKQFTKEEWDNLSWEEQKAYTDQWMKERGSASAKQAERKALKPLAKGRIVDQGTRGAWYAIRGDAAKFEATKHGYHVYVYLNEKGQILYVGKSGSILLKTQNKMVDVGVLEEGPSNWIDRLRKDHITTQWIGQAKYVRVFYDLTEQEMWALEEVLIPTSHNNIRGGDYLRKYPSGDLSANAASAQKGSQASFGFEAFPR